MPHTAKIDDTFAEAFPMVGTRLIITAIDLELATIAALEFCGNASSVIGCDCEAGIERGLGESRTPDGRPGVSVLAFAFNRKSLEKAVSSRIGQNVLTCPTTAVYSGLTDSPKEDRIKVGAQLRYFGDGFQKSKLLGGRRYWRVPVMDGEFLLEEKLGVGKGVAGGNIILQGTTPEVALAAARRGSEAVAKLSGVITPFPGGVVRSGSKVGSTYKGMVASTNDAYCPTLRGRVQSDLVDGANCAYEIVIDGVDEAAVGRAMHVAIETAAGDGVLAIGAGNYGGKLGKFHFHLHKLLSN